MSRVRWVPVLCATALVGSVGACAGGPGVKGPAAVALFESYSGTWVLDTATSERLPEAGRAMRGRGRGGGGDSDPFGGGRGGNPFGGRQGGFGGGGREGPPPGGGGRGGFAAANPEATRVAMALARTRPERIDLQLSDSLFVIEETPGRRMELPMKGGDVEFTLAGWPVKTKLEWDNHEPSVKRAPKDASDVVDHYELLSPDRLLVTREFEMPARGKVQVRFVYDRKKPS